MISASQISQGLNGGRSRLLEAIAGISEEMFKRRPEIGSAEDGDSVASVASWSIAEVLAHLLASERLRAERIRRALQQDGFLVTPSDPGAHVQLARTGRSSPVPQLIHGMLAVRREVNGLLKEATNLEGGFERAITHPINGRQSVGWMLTEKIIAHEAEHLEQIEALKTTLAPILPKSTIS